MEDTNNENCNLLYDNTCESILPCSNCCIAYIIISYNQDCSNCCYFLQLLGTY